MLRIYNTLTSKKEQFDPIDPPEVKMYVCGPTVYGPAHVGHAKTYVVFDVVRRYLEYRGYRVRYVQNFTDVDDKIISRAQASGEAWDVLSSRYSEEFLQEMEDLNVRPADIYPRASSSIGGITEDIAGLVRQGKAYALDGDVYFRVLSDPDYGKLSHRRLDEMRAGARVGVDERKEHPMDFALWKAAKPGEPAWDSPWGMGRPGWHIECSTMILYTLGERIDIHGGGADLIFPHHENEIAQSEQLTGKVPFAKFWMHSGLVQWDGEKMSRSVGNVLSARQVINEHGADAFRWFVLSSGYRRPVMYTAESMEFAKNTVRRVAAANLRQIEPGSGEASDAYRDAVASFQQAMDDDFNTPQALAILVELSREVNRLNSSGADPSGALCTLRSLADVLGFRLEPERDEDVRRDIAPFVDLLVEVRSELRAAKQWSLADRIRGELRERGIELEDRPDGTTSWHAESEG